MAFSASFFSMEKRSQKPSKGETPVDNPRRPRFRQLQLTRIYHCPSGVRPAREHAIYRASPSNAETEPEDFTRWYTSVVCLPDPVPTAEPGRRLFPFGKKIGALPQTPRHNKLRSRRFGRVRQKLLRFAVATTACAIVVFCKPMI